MRCDLLTSKQVSIVALKQGEIRIVQASMLGSILSNILLVSSDDATTHTPAR
jgi:hypothetical protein